MTDPSVVSEPLLIGGATLLINVILLAVGGGWFLGRMEARLTEKITSGQRDHDDNLVVIRREMAEGDDRTRRECGEGLAALREGIHANNDALRQFELWSRDNFLKKESFNAVMTQVRTDFKEMLGKVETAVAKLSDGGRRKGTII